MTDASIERANRLLLGETPKLDAILKALVETPTEVVGQPKPPKKIELSDEAHHALQILPAVFGRVQPEVVRPLTDVEQKEIGEEALTLEAILNDLKARQEAIKETIRHHLDRTAITSGRVTPDTPIDKNGHYVLGELKNPARLPIPGTNREWSSEYRSGKVTLSFDELLRLYEVGFPAALRPGVLADRRHDAQEQERRTQTGTVGQRRGSGVLRSLRGLAPPDAQAG
jgi:hypothetical protein